MDVLRRMNGHSATALLLAGILVIVSLVSGKPYLGNGEELDLENAVVGCFSQETNRTYGVGEKWATGPPFMCAMIECTGPNSFAALPCATFLAPEWCIEEPGDQTAVYPACCPFARCPEETPELNTPKPTDISWEPESSNRLP